MFTNWIIFWNSARVFTLVFLNSCCFSSAVPSQSFSYSSMSISSGAKAFWPASSKSKRSWFCAPGS